MGAAAAPSMAGWKGFQGLEGQWVWLSAGASGDAEGLEAAVSSSDDSSLAAGLEGDCAGGDDGEGEAEEGGLYRKFLRGDQPGGRRLLKVCRVKYSKKGFFCSRCYIVFCGTEQSSIRTTLFINKVLHWEAALLVHTPSAPLEVQISTEQHPL